MRSSLIVVQVALCVFFFASDAAPIDKHPAGSNAATGDVATGDTATCDAATGDRATGDPATRDTATCDAATGDGATGDGATGDTATCDAATGDTATGDAATGDAATGDAETGDPATGDPATGDPATGDAANNDEADSDLPPPVQLETLPEFKEKFKLFIEVKPHDAEELSEVELEEVLISKGVTVSNDDLKTILKAADVDQNGTLNQYEYERLMVIIEAFGAFDRDMDGYIGLEELRDASAKLGTLLTVPHATKLMRSFGKQPDGKISYTDFVRIWKTAK